MCRPGGLQDQTQLECQGIALAPRLKRDIVCFCVCLSVIKTRNTTQSVFLIQRGSKNHSN